MSRRERTGQLSRRALLAGAPFLPAIFASACHRSHDVDAFGFDAGLLGLVRDPDGILDLPPDFAYRILQRTGDPMSDGFLVPGRPDGMYCVAGDDDTIVLLRNQENRDGYGDFDAYTPEHGVPEQAYDRLSPGGVTRVVLDGKSLELKSSNLVLTGTSWNCASGPSPWGFLTCEETTAEDHGFVFLCPWDASSVQAPQRIDGYGRYRHEAAAIDPETAIAYLTEDQPSGSFYRFVPHAKDKPFEGVLQALAVRGRPGFDTGSQRVGERVDVEWIDVEDPTPALDTVRSDAQAKGAARVQRAEGIYFADGQVFLCATTGGPGAWGQVLRLDVREQTLEVIAESGTPDLMSGPDNVCVSPHGVLYIAEDGVGDRHLRRVTLDGEVMPFARNALSQTEMGGLCFSPDGGTLFANIQEEGLTLAIEGPFAEIDIALARAPRRKPHAGLATLARAAHQARRIG